MAHAKLSPSARPRTDAKRTGKLKYIGKPCKCGMTERYASTGGCVACTLTESAARPRSAAYRRSAREAQERAASHREAA